MCGIIGIVGAPSPFDALLDGLFALEYRGYDSAGVVIVDLETKSLWRRRVADKKQSIATLSKVLGAPESAGAAIGHTRWATHGPPSEADAHPHLDCSGRVGIVHNGIIENHRELAAELVSKGHTFTSQTDSEVLAHLIETEMAAGSSLAEALRACIGRLRGDFAVALTCADEPDVLVAARRTSPLIIGLTKDVGLVASDIAALLGTTRELYQLADNDVAVVRPGSIEVTNAKGENVSASPLVVSWDVADAQKGGWPDFMSKEIREQPAAVAETLLGRVEPDGSTDLEELVFSNEQLASTEHVLLVACGSSNHAALVARQTIERWAKIPAEADIASEFRYRNPVLTPNTLVICVSQSGETIDTLHAMHEARRRGARAIALTNVVGSAMTREADGVLYTRAGPEISVASTKCHVAQISLLQAFALHLANAKGSLSPEEKRAIATELLALPQGIERALSHVEAYEAVATRYAATKDFYFLGRGTGYPIALEGALKLKELAYVRAEAYAAGEMKHGPISLIEPGAVVVVAATRSALWEKVIANVEEMRARGATVIALADEGDAETASLVDAVLEVPPASDLFAPVVDIISLQCFAYAIARARGLDVDRPRNLAKVVTVE